MSKIGKINISIPEKVKVALAGNILNIEGPMGKKSLDIDLEIFNLDIKDGKEISLKVRSTKNAVLFTVSDRGLGISAEKQKTLFSGRTESAPGTQQERGSGFGLLIVKEYVDLHQGSISLESSPGKGSTFTVSIPFKPH